jgi:hypothetical protein
MMGRAGSRAAVSISDEVCTLPDNPERTFGALRRDNSGMFFAYLKT